MSKDRSALASLDDDEKDAPLRDDIRLLGRILGDTVRQQEGADVYAIVERIRQASIRFHRDNEIGARRELAATLDSLDAEQTFAIVRGYLARKSAGAREKFFWKNSIAAYKWQRRKSDQPRLQL